MFTVHRSSFIVLSTLFITVIIAIAFYKNYKTAQKPLPPGQKTVENSITLPLHKKINIPQTDLSVKLLEVDAPDENCRDCIEYAKIRVSRNSEIRELEFKSGGIVGYIQTAQETFGYIFSIEKFNTFAVQIRYKKITVQP